MLQLVLAVVLLGASWPVTKLALLDGVTPSWFAMGRAGLSLVATAAAVFVARQVRWPGQKDLPTLLSLGLLQLAGYFAFAHAAVAWVPAGRTAILANSTLIWTVPIALLTHEAVSRRRWAATALCTAGIVVLIGPWAIDWSSTAALLGHGFLLGAALCWAATMAIMRRWPPRLSMFALLPWAFAIASVALLPMALAHDGGRWSRDSLVCLLAVGLLMAPVGTWCLVQATQALPLIVASVGFLAGPAIGLLLSTVWLHEPFTASIGVGAGLILAGAGLAAGSARA